MWRIKRSETAIKGRKGKAFSLRRAKFPAKITSNSDKAMRLWSIHPKYLDPAGLTACWREGLLAREVLCGRTSGYRNHPQLARFKEAEDPVRAIDRYLEAVWEESVRRGYRFDATKVVPGIAVVRLTVSCGQLDYEFEHLKRKLELRSPKNYMRLIAVRSIEPHPLFRVTTGGVAVWEIIR